MARETTSRYRFGDLIDRGATGAVYEAWERATDRKVAIKVLHSEFASDVQTKTRFLGDAAILLTLRHRNLVEVIEPAILPEFDDSLALVMEFVGGGDLRTYIRENAPIESEIAVGFTRQILTGLGVAHEHGIVHRDVKPENVLLDVRTPTSPVLKVSDFGIARIANGPHLTNATAQGYLGTADYSAPEMRRKEGSPVTGAADFYAVGLVLYEMLTGSLPERGMSLNGIDPALAVVIEELIDPDPSRRPADAVTAIALLDEGLNHLGAGQVSGGTENRSGERNPTRVRRRGPDRKVRNRTNDRLRSRKALEVVPPPHRGEGQGGETRSRRDRGRPDLQPTTVPAPHTRRVWLAVGITTAVVLAGAGTAIALAASGGSTKSPAAPHPPTAAHVQARVTSGTKPRKPETRAKALTPTTVKVAPTTVLLPASVHQVNPPPVPQRQTVTPPPVVPPPVKHPTSTVQNSHAGCVQEPSGAWVHSDGTAC